MLKTLDYMNIFHEIKNSITLISSSLQLVAKKHPDVTEYEYWNEASQELTYLRNLVIELSQTNVSQSLNTHPVNIYDLVAEITSSFKGLSEDSDFHCKTDIARNLPLISMDPIKMKQAITNLLKNAYDAMQQTGTVYLNIYTNNSFLQVDVIDFGGGILDSVKDSLFNVFVTSKESGTGLGLAITKQIIEAHSGQIVYQSRPNDGCTFSLLLPLC